MQDQRAGGQCPPYDVREKHRQISGPLFAHIVRPEPAPEVRCYREPRAFSRAARNASSFSRS